MKTIKTKFGNLFVESGVGFGYNLYDSNKELLQSYDNDMPIRWAKILKDSKTEQGFFDTLFYLMGGESTLIFETNKKRFIKEIKDIYSGCDFCDNDFIKNQTFKVGKHYVFYDFDYCE